MLFILLPLLNSLFPLLQILLRSLFKFILILLLLLFLLLAMFMRQIGKSLHHRVDFLLLVVHELLLERILCGQVQSVQQICSPLQTGFFLVIENLHFFFRFEGKVCLDGFRDLEGTKNSLVSFSIQLLVVSYIQRVLFNFKINSFFSSQFCMRFYKSICSIVNCWVVELRKIY